MKLPPLTRHSLGALATIALALSLGTMVATGSASDTATDLRAKPAPHRTVEYQDSVPDNRAEATLASRSRAISTSAPEIVDSDATILIAGVVKVRSGRRPVHLLESTPQGWKRLAKRASLHTGAFRFKVSAGSTPSVRTFQVRAPRAKHLAAANTGSFRIEVAAPEEVVPLPEPPPVNEADVPRGSPDDWSYLFASRGGARWNPCAAIRWAYNPSGGYADAQAHVQDAFARIARHTGLTFSYVGETEHVEKTGTAFPTDVDITVGWANEAQVPDLAGGVVGLGGGSVKATLPGSDVGYKFVRGYVVLDNGHNLRQGYDTSGSTTWGQVMLHEQLHSLGLGHANGTEQIMSASSTTLNHNFGAGDLTGMARVGAGQGCL